MSSIYIHIPFCKSRCIYCDFYSTTDAGKKSRYVECLNRELHLRRSYLPSDEVVTSIYFGGGTPSQLSSAMLSSVLETVFSLFDVSPDAEITVEMNPDDVTADFLSSLLSMRVNRVSMGVQTFDDSRLAFLHRRHSSAQAEKAVRLCQEAGVSNISFDLIYGFPGETLDDWEADVSKAVALGVPHISAYSLMYEEGTALTRMLNEGNVSEIDEDLSLDMYRLLMSRLHDAGFVHYEISNFALPGFHSRHNSGYWTGTKYLGIGASAHSFDGVSRQWNPASVDKYMSAVEAGEPLFEREVLSESMRYDERVMTSLRTCDGIDLSALQRDFGREKLDYCLDMARKHIDDGCLELLSGYKPYLRNAAPADALRLTRKGLFVSDDIMSDLMLGI